MYPAKDNLPINNPLEDHIVAHEPYDNNWHRSLPTPFKRLGIFLETVLPTNLLYFRRIAPPQNQKLCDVISLILGDLKGVPTPSRQIHFKPCPRAKVQNTLFSREPLFIKQVTHETAHLKERYLRYLCVHANGERHLQKIGIRKTNQLLLRTEVAVPHNVNSAQPYQQPPVE